MREPIERHCIKCGAEPGQPCVGSRGNERKAYHRDRGARSRAAKYATHALSTDSPIENALVGAIIAWIDHHDVADAAVQTQVPVGPYRIDILITCAGRQLAVECDGAEFHSSPDAVARDKRRDRFCATKGIAVMRFSGSEIVRNPRDCAAQIGLWVRAQR